MTMRRGDTMKSRINKKKKKSTDRQQINFVIAVSQKSIYHAQTDGHTFWILNRVEMEHNKNDNKLDFCDFVCGHLVKFN